MKRTIWEYDIPIVDEFMVKMPYGAEILSVAVQHGKPRMWALVNPLEILVGYNFILVGTGQTSEIDGFDYLGYKGSFLLHGGDLVFHVFRKDDLPF